MDNIIKFFTFLYSGANVGKKFGGGCPNPTGDKCRLDSEIIKSDRLGHSSLRVEG